jgi:Calcineurin-like phosphoesterase
MRHLLLADIHATEKPPQSCTDTYWPDLLDLLVQSVRLARAGQAASVTWAGDVFHHKGPTRTSHAVVRALARVLQAYPCPAGIVGGNHDMQHDRRESIDSQPLGVLYVAGARELVGWDVAAGLATRYGVPWLQRWTEETIYDALEAWREPRLPLQPALVVTHAPIYPPGQEPRYEGAEFTPAGWWAAAMGHRGHLFYGHVHEPHGTWEHLGVTFCNNGALSRGALTPNDLERQPGCTWWDDVTGEFEFVPLAARPGSEVFRVAEHEAQVQAAGRLDEFLAQAAGMQLPRLTAEGVMDLIRQRGLSKNLQNLVEELLAEAAHGGTR